MNEAIKSRTTFDAYEEALRIREENPELLETVRKKYGYGVLDHRVYHDKLVNALDRVQPVVRDALESYTTGRLEALMIDLLMKEALRDLLEKIIGSDDKDKLKAALETLRGLTD